MYVRMRSAPLISHTDTHPTQWIRAFMYLPRPFLMCMPYVCADEEHTSSITGESWRRFTIAGSGWNFRRNSSSAMGPVKMTLLDQTLQLHVIPLLSHTLTYCHIYGVSLVMNHLHLAPQLALSGMECAAISSCRCRIRKGNKHHY